MSRIVRNALLNGLALAATSVLSLVLVPLLIRHYGLEAYGLLPLLRLFTPLGALGIGTLGIPQLATRAAALHSARGQHAELLRSQSTLVAVAGVLGAGFAAILLGLGPDRLARWLNVKTAEHAGFVLALNTAALLLPVLMAGVVINASLSGLGRFRVLRGTEVAVYLLYFAAAAGAVAASLPVVVVVLCLLASDTVRSLVLLFHARRAGLVAVRHVIAPDMHWLWAQRHDFTVISASSLLGYTRKFLPATSIPVVFGPAALGIYDAIERVPRAFKTLLGLVSTSSLPRALQLDAKADKRQLRSLLVRGTRITLLGTLPLCATVMIYAPLIVSLWLGRNLAYGGVYLVLLMIPFVVDATLSIVGTATLSRVHLIYEQGKVTIIEIVVFLATLVALVPPAGENSPYAATAVAAVAGFVLRVRAFLPAYGISFSAWLALLMKVISGSALGSATVFVLARLATTDGRVTLLTAPVAALAGAALVVAFWSAEDRRDLRSVAASLRDLLSRRAPR